MYMTVNKIERALYAAFQFLFPKDFGKTREVKLFDALLFFVKVKLWRSGFIVARRN